LTINKEVLKKVEKLSTVLLFPRMLGTLESMTEEGAFLEVDGYKPQDAMQVLIDAGVGLTVLHERCNVMHLDIKPANVLIGMWDGATRGYIGDFGCSSKFDLPLVRVGVKGRRDRLNSTTVTDVFGTDFYRAPEVTTQFQNFKAGRDSVSVSLIADLYGYAYMCWDVLFGFTAPVEGERQVNPTPEMAGKHLNANCTTAFSTSIRAFIKCVNKGDYTVKTIIEAVEAIKSSM
jgi:serine/threonine protein kinase